MTVVVRVKDILNHSNIQFGCDVHVRTQYDHYSKMFILSFIRGKSNQKWKKGLLLLLLSVRHACPTPNINSKVINPFE